MDEALSSGKLTKNLSVVLNLPPMGERIGLPNWLNGQQWVGEHKRSNFTKNRRKPVAF